MPVTEIHLGFGRATYVTIFSLIAVLILVIACINYANLATARSANRIREVGLRLVNGARKKQLIQQFLSESVLTTTLSFLLSLILVILLLPILNNLTGKEITLNLLQNSSLLIILLPLILLVGILAGVYPAFFLTRVAPAESLKGARGRESKVSRFRIFSVIAQFAISVLLIICTIVIYQQLDYIQNRPLGFSTSNVLKIPINPVILGRFTHYKNLLRENSGILAVTAGQAVPYNEDYKTGGLNWEGKDPQRTTNVRYSISHYNYLETFGMVMKAGEGFEENNRGDLTKYIINEKMAEYMGIKDPVGKSLTFWGRTGIIKGVVKNYHHVPLHREIMPQVFTINPEHWRNLKFIFIKIASANVPETLEFIREKTKTLAPGHPFSYAFLDREMGRIYQSEQRIGKMIGYFAFLAIFISCLGLFGLASFLAENRTKEIGIRKVLGATIPGILFLLNKQFIKWVLLANIVAWPLAYYAMSGWLKGFAYKINLNVWPFILAPLMAMAIAFITVSYQAIRVALARPVDSLRYE
jgi:ABC-type antimicrobial peptide transport system permease subunit